MDLIKVDVTKPEDLITARETVQQRMSDNGLKLHALVNNAGIMKSNYVTLDSEPTVQDYEFQMDVNFYGVVSEFWTDFWPWFHLISNNHHS